VALIGRLAPGTTVKKAVLAAALVTLVSGCGGYYYPTFPSDTEPSLPSPRLLRVVIDGEGVHPAVSSGPRALVEFVNQDTQSHEIYSDPHPRHSECLELNLGEIPPGETVSILTPFEIGSTCGYHDETQPDDPRFQGSIWIR
jgi:hypothetical protein